jgi:solute carrier organic anion transporter family, member 4A
LIPVSYFGGRVGASKPKWVGFGIIIMGLGFLTFSLPHFLVGPYRAEKSDDHMNLCDISRDNETSSECSTDPSQQNGNGFEDLSWNVWFFFVAQLLHGIGKFRIFPYNVKKLTSFLKCHLSLYRSIATLHPRRYLYRRKRFQENVFCIFR